MQVHVRPVCEHLKPLRRCTASKCTTVWPVVGSTKHFGTAPRMLAEAAAQSASARMVFIASVGTHRSETTKVRLARMDRGG